MAESRLSSDRRLRLRLGEQSFPLDAEKLVVGRSRSCDLRLRDDTVSRLHAAFVWSDEGLVLEDMGSSNGTFLNGVRILEPHTVALGDDIRFGSLRGTVERWDLRIEETTASLGAAVTEIDLSRAAGFGWRLLAVAVDLILFSAGSAVAFAPWYAGGRLLRLAASGPALQVRSALPGISAALWILFTFFYVVHGWAQRSGTPGLRLLGLRLLDWRHRTPIGYPRAFLRLAALLVTILTLGLGYLVVPFRRDRKALHDLLAGTLVTRRVRPFGGRPGSA